MAAAVSREDPTWFGCSHENEALHVARCQVHRLFGYRSSGSSCALGVLDGVPHGRAE